VIAAAVNGGEAIAPTGEVGGRESIPAFLAAERVQQLQALIAQVERPSANASGSTFAGALSAAQAGGATEVAGSTTESQPTVGSYPGSDLSAAQAGLPAGQYSDLSMAAYPSGVAAAQYPADLPTAQSFPSIAQSSLDTTGAGGASLELAAAEGAPNATSSVALDAAPGGTATGGEGGSAYVPLIEQAAARCGLDPAVLYGLIQQESGFDPSATSSAGAQGLTQLMPSTAASLGVTEPLDPAQSIEGGARYLSQLMHQFAGNTSDALAAYNAGPGAVQQYGGVPPYPETQQYVTKVLGYAAAAQAGVGSSPSGLDASAATVYSPTAGDGEPYAAAGVSA
jgi:soluble lytic murein transglycosylase-like protein